MRVSEVRGRKKKKKKKLSMIVGNLFN